MSKQAIAANAANKLESLVRLLMTEAAREEGPDLLSSIEVARVISNMAANLRRWKDETGEDVSASSVKSRMRGGY